MSDIGDRIKQIVVEHLGVEESKVTPEASFIDDLGADSLDTVELVMAFEEAFGVEIPEDAAEKGRFLRPLTWVRQGDPDDNGYARPVEGLIVRFDLDRMEVVDIEDHGVIPLPPASGNYTAGALRDRGN